MDTVSNYNVIDIFIIATLLITLILGLWKGFVKTLTALAGLVLGVLLSMKYYPEVQPYLARVTSLDSHISMILSMIVIFILVQAFFVIVRRILEAILEFSRLSWLDRVCGAAMGIAGGFLIVAVAAEMILLGAADWQSAKQSKLLIPLNRLTQRVLTYAPPEAQQRVKAFKEKLQGSRPRTGALPAPSPAAVPSGPESTRTVPTPAAAAQDIGSRRPGPARAAN